jgi:type I site-specific restriction endonuclease
MNPEDEARRHIDDLLRAAGWSVQDVDQVNLRAARGVARVLCDPLPNNSTSWLYCPS